MFQHYAEVKCAINVSQILKVENEVDYITQIISQDEFLVIATISKVMIATIKGDEIEVHTSFNFHNSTVSAKSQSSFKSVAKTLLPRSHNKKNLPIRKKGIQMIEIIPKWKWIITLYNGKLSILSYSIMQNSIAETLSDLIYENATSLIKNKETFFEEQNTTRSSALRYSLSIVRKDIEISNSKLISHFAINKSDPTKIAILEEVDNSGNKSKSKVKTVKNIAKVVITKGITGSNKYQNRYIRIMKLNPLESSYITKCESNNDNNGSYILTLPGKINGFLYANDVILLSQKREYFLIDANNGNLIHESKPNETLQPMVSSLFDTRENNQNSNLIKQYLNSRSPGFPYFASHIASDPHLFDRPPKWGNRKPMYKDKYIIAMDYSFPFIICLQMQTIEFYHLYTKKIVLSLSYSSLLKNQFCDGELQVSMCISKNDRLIYISISSLNQSYISIIQLQNYLNQRKIMVHPWKTLINRKKHTIYLPEAMKFLKDEYDAKNMKLKKKMALMIEHYQRKDLKNNELKEKYESIENQLDIDEISEDKRNTENQLVYQKKINLIFQIFHMIEELKAREEAEVLYLLAALSCLTNNMGYNSIVVSFERFLLSECHVAVVLSLFKNSLLKYFPIEISWIKDRTENSLIPCIPNPYIIEYLEEDFFSLISENNEIFVTEGLTQNAWRKTEYLMKYLWNKKERNLSKVTSLESLINSIQKHRHKLSIATSQNGNYEYLINECDNMEKKLKYRLNSFQEQTSLIDSAFAILLAFKECSSINIANSEFENYNVDTFLKTSSSRCDETLFRYCESILEDMNNTSSKSIFLKKVVKKLQTSVVFVYARTFSASSSKEEIEFSRRALYKSLAHIIHSHNNSLSLSTYKKNQNDEIHLSLMLCDIFKHVPLSRAKTFSQIIKRFMLEKFNYRLPRFLICSQETYDLLFLIEDALELIVNKYEFSVNSLFEEREEFINIAKLLANLRIQRGEEKSFLHHCDALDFIRDDLVLTRFREKRQYRERMRAMNHTFFMEISYLEKILEIGYNTTFKDESINSNNFIDKKESNPIISKVFHYRGYPVPYLLSKHYLKLILSEYTERIGQRNERENIPERFYQLVTSIHFIEMAKDSNDKFYIKHLQNLLETILNNSLNSEHYNYIHIILVKSKIALHNIMNEHEQSLRIILQQKGKEIKYILQDAANYCLSLNGELHSKFVTVMKVAHSISLFENQSQNGNEKYLLEFIDKYHKFIPFYEIIEYIPSWIPLHLLKSQIKRELDYCHHELWTKEIHQYSNLQRLYSNKIIESAKTKQSRIIVESDRHNICFQCKQNILLAEQESFALVWVDESKQFSLVHEKCLTKFEKENVTNFPIF